MCEGDNCLTSTKTMDTVKKNDQDQKRKKEQDNSTAAVLSKAAPFALLLAFLGAYLFIHKYQSTEGGRKVEINIDILSYLNAVKQLDVMALLSPYTFFAAAITLVIASPIYKALFAPLYVNKTLDDYDNCGYDRHKYEKRLGQTPPPFPNGWFYLFHSNDVKKGQVKYADVLGNQLVVFRDEEGVIRVLDAICPHLGANMAFGGRVVGNGIECPFHLWQFNGSDGVCSKIPYSSNPVPSVARVKSWPVKEVVGLILVWHDAEEREPFWEPDNYSEVSKGYYYHGRTLHEVQAHIQELPENGADVAHLSAVHSNFVYSNLSIFSPIHHTWTASWQTCEAPREHMTQMHVTHGYSLFGLNLPFRTQVYINQVGPGLVFFRFQMPVGECFIVQTVTPLKANLQQCTHTVYGNWTVPRWVAKFVLKSVALQLEKDIPIWNNKTFIPNPMVVKDEPLIPRFRRWYAKFYSKNSDKLQNKNNNSLEW